MKFFAAALFAGVAVASSVGSPVVKRAALVERDAAAASSAIAAISDATKKLGTAVEGFQAQGGDIAGLQSASQDLIDTINKGTSDVEAGGDLTQADALGLPQPVQDLASLVDDTVQKAIDKKPEFDSAGISSVVKDQLGQQQEAAKKFSDTLISKVPEGLQQIAKNLAAPIDASLQKAVDAYKDAGSGSPSPSSGAGSSAAASATASAPADSSAPAATTGGDSEPTATATEGAGGAYPTSGSGSGNGTTPAEPNPSIITGAGAKNVVGLGSVVAVALAVAAF